MIGILLTVVGTLALLVATWRHMPWLGWVAKPVASGGFLVTLAERGDASPYTSALAVALGLCALGDLLLIPKGAKRAFIAGLITFLLGHLGLVWAFVLEGVSPERVAGVATLLLVPLIGVARWLLPRVRRELRGPVFAYMLVITAMVSTAAGAEALPAVVLPAALAFYASDIFVAIERFVHPSPWNRTFGLPLYYLATQLLAWSSGG